MVKNHLLSFQKFKKVLKKEFYKINFFNFHLPIFGYNLNVYLWLEIDIVFSDTMSISSRISSKLYCGLQEPQSGQAVRFLYRLQQHQMQLVSLDLCKILGRYSCSRIVFKLSSELLHLAFVGWLVGRLVSLSVCHKNVKNCQKQVS